MLNFFHTLICKNIIDTKTLHKNHNTTLMWQCITTNTKKKVLVENWDIYVHINIPWPWWYQANTSGTVALAQNAIYAAVSCKLRKILVARIGTTNINKNEWLTKTNYLTISEWQLANLNIVEENEFPAVKMSSNGNVHVLNSSPFQPTPSILQSLNPPHTGGSIESEKVNENRDNTG